LGFAEFLGGSGCVIIQPTSANISDIPQGIFITALHKL